MFVALSLVVEFIQVHGPLASSLSCSWRLTNELGPPGGEPSLFLESDVILPWGAPHCLFLGPLLASHLALIIPSFSKTKEKS